MASDSVVVGAVGNDAGDARSSIRWVDQAFDIQKGKVYQERMIAVRKEMEQLREGIHPDFLLGSTVLISNKETRICRANRVREYMNHNAKSIYESEEKMANAEYVDSRLQLQSMLRTRLESELEIAEKEQKEICLSGDALPFRDESQQRAPRQGLRNKKARVESSTGSFLSKSQRKAVTPMTKPITHRLTDYCIDQDLKNIKNILKQSRAKSTKLGGAAPVSDGVGDVFEAAYVDGVLRYDGQDFTVGDSICVESATTGRYACMVTVVNSIEMWVKRGNNRVRVQYASLRLGRFRIRKIQPANWLRLGTKPIRPP